jgi:hypothetical protein
MITMESRRCTMTKGNQLLSHCITVALPPMDHHYMITGVVKRANPSAVQAECKVEETEL